ncbi:neurogenic locus notch homolog protein 1 [Anabrus simplex]|uniref:neurogenic locus notch homolog protein 1 n=1 Tax=Anabrus simplex TaxID=316456 RepID=UPI0035A27DBB
MCDSSVKPAFSSDMLSVISVIVMGVLQLITAAPTPDNTVPEVTEWMSVEGASSVTSVMINPSDLNLEISCTDKQDGVYRHGDSCKIYYRCSKGRREVFRCSDGFLFSATTVSCEAKANVSCNVTSEACHFLSNGLHPNRTSGCQEYFRCENHTVTATYSCRPGLAFSMLEQACVPAAELSCVGLVCAATESAVNVVPGTRCRAYYRCRHGLRSEHVCPGEQVFDPDKQTCVETDAPCYEPLCTGRVNGRYPDTSHGCRRSFQCVGGALRAVVGCPAGRLHNGHACLSSAEVKCPAPDRTAVAYPVPAADLCAGVADGTHAAPDVHCRRYLLCRAGQTISDLRCPLGLRFDGRRCTPAASKPCASDCLHFADGYHAVPGSSCRQYMYCLAGRSVTRKTCAEGTLFNGHMCVPSPIFSCPTASPSSGLEVSNDCAGLEDGFHADYSSGCREYFYCVGRKAVLRRSCEDDFVWDGETCVERRRFMCEGPEMWAGCSALGPGLHQDRSPTSQCRNYFYCAGGNRTRLSCPQGQLFDGYACVGADTYTCPSLEPDSCDQKTDGYYQDPSSGCRSYFYCSSGHKITYVCSGAFVFNGKECVDPTTYKCPFSSEDCTGQPNGYHYDTLSLCRKYFFCLEGAKITTLTCAENKVFNGRRCVEPSAFQCPTSSDTSACTSRPDGLYVEPGSGCRRYVQCAYQKPVTVSWCPEGTLFDGSMCAPSYECRTTEPAPSLDCSNALNGFYQNITSGCRSYFFCIDGMKTTLTCPGNELFNGQLCVDSNTYTCPSPCTNNSTGCEMSIKTDCETYPIQYIFITTLYISVQSV